METLFTTDNAELRGLSPEKVFCTDSSNSEGLQAVRDIVVVCGVLYVMDMRELKGIYGYDSRAIMYGVESLHEGVDIEDELEGSIDSLSVELYRAGLLDIRSRLTRRGKCLARRYGRILRGEPSFPVQILN